MEPETKTYYPLGNKTLFMISFKKSVIIMLMLPGFVFGFFLPQYISDEYANLWSNAMVAYSFILMVGILLTLFVSWLEYIRYSIIIGEKSMKLHRGLINTEELGIPYRRIKDTNIKRSLIDQIFGMSDIVVTVIDADNNFSPDQEMVIMLPSLPRHMARDIQDMILRKAQVEEINVMSRGTDIHS